MSVATEILAIRQETPIDRTLQLAVPSEAREAFDFTPGQFVVLRDPDATAKRQRAYSISSPPGLSDRLEITVRDMGTFGHSLYDYPVGKVLRMRPPAGRFVLHHEPNDHLLMVAGGSGVTPFHSFVGHLQDLGTPARSTLLQSAQQPAELIFHPEFVTWAEASDTHHYVPTVTRLAEKKPWSGRQGRIDEALVAASVSDATRTRFYTCGPAPFVKAMLAAAEALGIPADRRHKEQW